MAGRATASPPAGAGPPPSSCPAVYGLRSSSSPCLRGPEPRAGRRRRGGPRCRCWPPTGGRPAPSGSACPLCSPTSARGDGILPGAPGTGGGRGCSRGGRAEPSAPHSWIPHSNFKSRLLLPPPPMGARPAAPQRLPIGCRACPSGGTAGRAARSPAGLDGAHPPGTGARAAPALRGAETVLLSSVHVGHGPVFAPSQPPAAREWSPRPESVTPGLTGYTSPASSSQGGSAPRRGRGPITPQPWEQPVPPVPPARRTRPELPLPVRVPATAGAGPDDGGPRRQRPGGQAGDTRHGPEQGARAAGHSRPLPSQTFLQRHPSKGFSATTRYFDIPTLSQDRA
ncbi:nascent polypeptide-associated complex subunit alpha, muscle-specific form-like [Molothrus ater]|uniref:nascent polypeptide-associated complex subunit alpha, muscle-specific form-like n=1 Tax=Molothrus ater TaxID=84834 RepID=UPI00174B59DD|nr:nascent polypeptide-associated complex subunit alpha, muscle-specific form-like [Molothrus ater]